MCKTIGKGTGNKLGNGSKKGTDKKRMATLQEMV